MVRSMKNSGIEWIGEIPDSWQLVNIGNVLKEYKNENKLLDTHALQFKYGTIVPKKETNATQDVLDILSKYNVVKPNIIMVNGLNLAFDFVTQRVALVKENGVITSTYIALSPQNLVVPQYATYVLKSYDFQKVFHSLGRGLRCMLSCDVLRREKMPLPSLDEQKSIVNYLEQKLAEVDKLIEVQQAQIEKLKEYKQSVITEAVTKGLDPNAPMKDSGVEWIGKIPTSWIVVKNKVLFRNVSIKGFGDSMVLSLYRDYGVIPKNSRDDNHNVTSLDTDSYKRVEINDLVINKMKAWSGSLAISDYDGIISPAYYICKVNYKYVDKRFIHNYLRNKYLVSLYEMYSAGLRVGQWDLSIDDFLNIEIALPASIEEQVQIATFIDDKCAKIDKLIALKQSKIEKLQEYKKSLIYEYVTGKKEVM